MSISFIASIAPLMSSIQIDGVDGNTRIKLDIPATEVEAV